MLFLIDHWNTLETSVRLLHSDNASIDSRFFIEKKSIKLLSPVPRPRSMRDGYAFRQHVETARRNRGVDMIPEFDMFPIFYFTNHQAVIGEGDMLVRERHLDRLDYELEVAIVTGKSGRDLSVEEADDYIFGYLIMNDWSARGLQMEEMKLNLGPAKGKDFATAMGPFLVPRSDLSPHLEQSENGEVLDLVMRGYINGKQYSEGNVNTMHWTFAQILHRMTYGVDVQPGEVVGSGTVGTGCLLELNGSKITNNLWIQENDVVTMEIDELGSLENRVVKY